MTVQVDGTKGINKVQDGCVTSDSLANSIRLPGAPTAATAPAGTNTEQIATTAFAAAADAALYSQIDAKKADKSYIDSLNAQPITYVTKSGHNSFGMLIGGKLYTTAGSTAGNHANATTGRFLSSQLGQFGLDNLKLVAFPENTPIQKVGGFVHGFAYALLTNGNLYTWGANTYGQCGLGHTNQVATPTLAATGVVDVYDHPTNSTFEVNSNRLFIKKSDGYIYGAGYNANGALGLGDTNNRVTFTQITALGTNITSLWNMGCGVGCTVAQKSDYSIWVAGWNGYGQLGNGNTNTQLSFIDVTAAWGGGAGKSLKKVIGGFSWADGTNPATLNSSLGMLLDDGTNTVFRVCGINTSAQLGNGSITGNATIPIAPIVGTGRIVDIAGVGSPATIQVLKDDGTLYAFGHNWEGEAGAGTSGSDLATPTIVASGVTALLADGINSHYYGWYAQSAILKASGLYMCGFNDNGYCGLGHYATPITTFSKTLLPADFTVKLLGSFVTTNNGRVYVAVSTDNRVYAWGYNGQNGLQAVNGTNIPTPANVIIPRG
jgi:alpha-tubulin suppressor-like RCC1 family protein